MPTIGELIEESRQVLAQSTESASLDAQVLLAHIVEKNRAWVIAFPERELTESQYDRYKQALQKLKSNTAFPYVLGHWEFYGRSFLVTPDVLIPRPETELLVETALAWLDQNPQRKQVADIGTGSGCIAITLAAENPKIQITAGDVSPAALLVAQENADKHLAPKRIQFHESNLLASIEGPFDLIAANLPYIPSETLKKLLVSQREPRIALDGGEDGLDLIERLLHQAKENLLTGGLILLEIDASQGESAKLLGEKTFPSAQVTVKSDIAGLPRLVIIQT